MARRKAEEVVTLSDYAKFVLEVAGKFIVGLVAKDKTETAVALLHNDLECLEFDKVFNRAVISNDGAWVGIQYVEGENMNTLIAGLKEAGFAVFMRMGNELIRL